VAKFTFQPTNSLRPTIKCVVGVRDFNIVELYSEWMVWLQADPENHSYMRAMKTSGNEGVGDDNAPTYVFMMNGWVVEPDDANHTLVVTGNIYPDPDNPTRPLWALTSGGSYQVIVEVNRSDQAQNTAEVIKAKNNAATAVATNFV